METSLLIVFHVYTSSDNGFTDIFLRHFFLGGGGVKLDIGSILKGIDYSPSYSSKPVRTLFLFGTQIKIFLMNSESSLTLP